MDHTDLEKYKNTNIGYFRDRPAPIVIEYKKNNEEPKMETKEVIGTSTETNYATKMDFPNVSAYQFF